MHLIVSLRREPQARFTPAVVLSVECFGLLELSR